MKTMTQPNRYLRTLWRQRFHIASVFILGGVFFHPTSFASETPIASPITMKNYVIIFRQGPLQLTEADLVQRQQEVSAWAREQNAAGHKLEPRILGPEKYRSGETMNTPNGDWPVTALLFLQATDLDEAGKIAASHPANRFGTSVEVRPWSAPVPPKQNPSAP